jgi:hypothetical protein
VPAAQVRKGYKRGAGLAPDDLASLAANALSVADGKQYGCAAIELIRVDGSADVVTQWLKEGWGSEHHHRSDGFAFMHQIEGIVDFLKRHGVGDQIVNIDLPFHVPIHNLRHIGTPARAAKG